MCVKKNQETCNFITITKILIKELCIWVPLNGEVLCSANSHKWMETCCLYHLSPSDTTSSSLNQVPLTAPSCSLPRGSWVRPCSDIQTRVYRTQESAFTPALPLQPSLSLSRLGLERPWVRSSLQHHLLTLLEFNIMQTTENYYHFPQSFIFYMVREVFGLITICLIIIIL